MKLRKVLVALLISSISITGFSFCGFYVAKADAKLFNKTSQVILVRDGDKTTVTMSNDFSGEVKDFAMVVPVPSVLKREDIRVVPGSLFTKLDAYSGPRLVEYYDQNPCYNYNDMIIETASSDRIPRMNKSTSVDNSNRKDYGVTIEAQYSVEEYDILILSAKESTGLKEWLIDNEYQIPVSAEEVLEPYIKNDMKFFVVKVNVEKLDEISGMGNVNKYIDDPGLKKVKNLRPLQITYTSPKFMLPIRLGMANANGDQDMIVYAFTREGRVECTNYRTTKIPTDKNVPLFVREKFGKFYVDLFEKAHMREDKEAIFLEYAWNIAPTFPGVKCDPCVGPPPIYSDFQQAGVDWAINQNNQAASDVFFTRLHVRYSRDTHPQDLLFHVTPNKEHFQARYILTNPATGDLSCDDGQKYCANLVKNRANELETLKDLTSWNTSQYADYVKEYYDKIEDKKILYEIDENNKKNFVIPVLPDETIKPNFGLKIIVLSSILALMLIVAMIRSARTYFFWFNRMPV
ncbi:MAG: DUF2330 domain-containing protein [Crocinitomicaceae bacterium]|nr:DUF2330 domain-containing protein [Crocinitomicaceae bacterium]